MNLKRKQKNKIYIYRNTKNIKIVKCFAKINLYINVSEEDGTPVFF